jgi:hypothetical protein
MIYVHASSNQCEFEQNFVFFHVAGYCYAVYIVYVLCILVTEYFVSE